MTVELYLEKKDEGEGSEKMEKEDELRYRMVL